MEHISVFDNSEIIMRRTNFKIIIYNTILFISLIIFVFLICFKNYHSYYNLKALVIKNEHEYYLKTLVLETDIDKINNTTLIIDNKEHKYKIKSISKEYLVDENYNKYYEVLLTCRIDKSLQINNNVIDINIKLPKTTYIKNLFKQMKKGMK